MRLEPGQVAVVTGAASGIGQALADAFAARGLEVAAADVESPDPDARVDVRRSRAGRRVRAGARCGGSGASTWSATTPGVVGPWVPTWEQRLEDWRWILEVNLSGVVHGIRAFVPHLVAQGSGHVVNVASIAGLAPVPGGGNAPYAASKYAVVAISEVLREELATAAPAVGVTVVCPGPVATRIRESERNRPVEHGQAVDSGSPPVYVDRLAPEAVAAQVLDAIEAGRPYVLPNPGSAAEIRSHLSRLSHDLEEQP